MIVSGPFVVTVNLQNQSETSYRGIDLSSKNVFYIYILLLNILSLKQFVFHEPVKVTFFAPSFKTARINPPYF